MKSAKARVDEIRALLEGAVEREQMELVDVELTSAQGRAILRVTIDTVPPGDRERGVTVDDCSRISRLLGEILDERDPLEGHYDLEVSSPGLFRPLTKPAHFDRVRGQRIKVKTFEKRDGRKVFIGNFLTLEGGELSIDVDGTEFRIPLDQVAKANLEPLL